MRELVRRAGLAAEVAVASRACRTDEIGSDTHAGTRRKLRAEGIPFERRAARLVRREDYERYDVIAAMDEENMRDLARLTGGDPWAPVSIMAHEIGHHLSGHTITSGGSRPAIELEADKFSGYVLYRMGATQTAATKAIMALVDNQIGNFGRPAHVWFVSQLPKTRSGKMLRRTIQAICEGRDPGDLTTIDDPASLDQIRQAMEE